MFIGKCLKCGWVGPSNEGLPQWFKIDEETEELLLICPKCKIGVVVEYKKGKKRR